MARGVLESASMPLTTARRRCRKPKRRFGRARRCAPALKVRTCGDLIDNLPELRYCVLGKSAAMGFLHEVAFGCGECGGAPTTARRTTSA